MTPDAENRRQVASKKTAYCRLFALDSDLKASDEVVNLTDGQGGWPGCSGGREEEARVGLWLWMVAID
jgi:hypothetical protein